MMGTDVVRKSLDAPWMRLLFSHNLQPPRPEEGPLLFEDLVHLMNKTPLGEIVGIV